MSAPGVSSEIAIRFSATFVVYCRSYVRDADLLLVPQRWGEIVALPTELGIKVASDRQTLPKLSRGRS